MCGIQGVTDFDCYPQKFLNRHRLSVQLFPKIPAIDILHGNVHRFSNTDVKDCDDAGVSKCACRLRLTNEPMNRLYVAHKILTNYLQGDNPSKNLISGLEDRSHSACADFFNLVV